MKKTGILLFAALFILTSCKNDKDQSDAYGNFESISVMVSSEAPGKILSLHVEEGQKIAKNEKVGSIDSLQLHLKKQQILATIQTVSTKSRTLSAQIETQEVRISNLNREYNRLQNLLKDGAATSKQIDDLQGNMDLLKSQVKGMKTQQATISAEKESLKVQIDQIDDQIRRTVIENPVDGVVLQKFKQEGEIIGAGMSLYKIANIDRLILRAYLSGQQLSELTIGKTVTVRFDGAEGIEELPGKVVWVASQAEFTPKIIQTKEERVNLVYACKVEVENDGRLKIGMPGEVKF